MKCEMWDINGLPNGITHAAYTREPTIFCSSFEDATSDFLRSTSLNLYLVTFVVAKNHAFSFELKFIPKISLHLAGSSHFLRFIHALVIVPMIIKFK